MTKKEKVIEGALKSAENEIQQFQTEKQQKLNELEVVLSLRMHQIQCLVNGLIPDSVSDCLVFASSGLRKLDFRVDQLSQEISELRYNTFSYFFIIININNLLFCCIGCS